MEKCLPQKHEDQNLVFKNPRVARWESQEWCNLSAGEVEAATFLGLISQPGLAH